MKEIEGKISVIMGAYNCQDAFQAAINSIERQTYDNWEMIICDDGSTDQTYQQLKDYSMGNPKIKVIRNMSNSGLAATLNHCLKYSDGEYVARMDADDISYPDRFEKQIEYLNKHPEISFISSSADIFDGKRIVGQRILLPRPQKKDLIWNTRFIHPATMFRTRVLKDVGGYRVSPDTLRGQDYDLFMRLYGAGYYGANLQKPVFRYTEDASNFKRRTLKARYGEFKIRYYGYKAMGVLPWAAPFLLKPFFVHYIKKIKGLLLK